tara:strand:- start:326 stop:538 length:213 start_codon:yes stop_codon:yes gene_type:complete
MATTRLGLYGGPRGPYGSFAGKTIATTAIPTQFGKKFYQGKSRETIKDFELKQDTSELLTIIKLITDNFL